jgi:hypothetical protein
MDVLLEAAGLAGAAGFDVVMWLAYLVLCGAMAIAAGVFISRALLVPRH